jgi:hypothetical protein
LNIGPGSWRIDDTSLVVDSALLGSAVRTGPDNAFVGTSTTEVVVPLTNHGADTLQFVTKTSNQLVTLTYNAVCVIDAPRGTWVSIRVVVDGQEAEPASGGDFALCSSIQPRFYMRQSAVTVPDIGNHAVQIFAKGSSAAVWALSDASLIVK